MGKILGQVEFGLYCPDTFFCIIDGACVLHLVCTRVCIVVL